jgi:hypothetical protein
LNILARFSWRWWPLFLVALHLIGCASGSTPLADVLSGVVSEGFGSGKESTPTIKPNPSYRYLRVEVEGRPSALLVLGYVDAHPLGNIEVWYSAKREVIKIQNGRIVSTTGLELDWRSVLFPTPPLVWTALPVQGVVYSRLRDEMPGHHYAIADQLALKPWPGVPPLHLPASLSIEQASSYQWFREDTLSTTAQPLPPAWFAWGVHRGQPTVVYSRQCLSATFCLRLQRWPVQEKAS